MQVSATFGVTLRWTLLDDPKRGKLSDEKTQNLKPSYLRCSNILRQMLSNADMSNIWSHPRTQKQQTY